MNHHPSVTVIILNWNGRAHLPECLGSLHRLTYPNIHCIMVDNGSTDGSREYTRSNFPEVEIVQHARNIGFAAGNNAGMRLALSRGSDYIALLNNDMEVDPRWIDKLVAAAEADPSIGACATKMCYFNNRDIIQGIGVWMNRAGVAWDNLNGRYEHARPHIAREALAACGGAFFVRAAALRKTGLFDPRYFIYLEDVELSMRIWDAGYRIVTVPAATVFHKFAATVPENSPRKNFLVERNRLRLILTCVPRTMLPGSLRALSAHYLGILHRAMAGADARAALTLCRSLCAFLPRLPGVIRKRLTRGPVKSPRVWQLVAEHPFPPRVRLPDQPGASWRDATEHGVWPGRNSGQLGPGWYRMYDKGDNFYRWFAREAFVSLRKNDDSDHLLVMELGNDHHHCDRIALTVFVNGHETGRVTPEPGMNRYSFELPAGLPEKVIVRLHAHGLYPAEQTGMPTDLSFRVKRVWLAQKDVSSMRIRPHPKRVFTT